MSLLSRFTPCQFLFDCPPLSLFLHHLGFSQSQPGLFSVLGPPSCFFLRTHICKLWKVWFGVLNLKPNLSQLCYVLLSTFQPCFSIRLHTKPHCLDTGRCTKLCLLLSLLKRVCKTARPCQDPFCVFTCPDAVGTRVTNGLRKEPRLLWKSCVVV